MKLKLFGGHKKGISVVLQKKYTIILVICAVIAVAISLVIGLSQSVWFDEAYSIMLAKQPISQIIHLTALDTHPPFYYLLLSLWGNLFGWSEFALRSLSVLSMGGAIIFAGLLTKKIFGVRAALITLPIVAFAPFLLRYGFEIRMYSLASLIGIAATYVLVCALESKNKKQIQLLYGLYAILVALGMFTLYYMALLWIAHFLWLLGRSYSKKEPLFKVIWIRAYIASVILFLPWLPTFFSQVSNGALAPIAQSMTLDNLLGIVSFGFVYRPVWQLSPLLSLIILFVILTLGYLSVRAFQLVDKKQKTYLTMLAMYLLIPIAILALVGLFRPMYVERYLAHILIGASIFIGVAIALVTKKASRIVKALCVLLVAVFALGLVQLIQVDNYNFQRLQHPEVKQAAVLMDCKLGSTILAADPYVAIELSYYLPSCPINFYSDTASLGGGYAPLSNSDLRIANPTTQLKSSKTIYYAHYGESSLTMPSNLLSTKQQVVGAMTIEQFVSK